MTTELTPKQERFLNASAFIVRAYIILAAIAFAAWCVYIAEDKYAALDGLGVPSNDIPRAAAWANIFAIYFPIISGAMGYLFAETRIAAAPLAPNGFPTAVFRDVIAVVVMTLILWIPIWQYDRPGPIKDVISFLAWYQSVAIGLAGVAFYYYYRSALKPFVETSKSNSVETVKPKPQDDPEPRPSD
jgi:hypothetical protein